MLRNFVLALSVVLAAVCAAGQQPATPLPPQPASTQTVSTLSVYAAGPDVTAPQLIPADFPTESVVHCKKKDGWVYLAAIVRSDGEPSLVTVFRADDPDLAELATQTAAKGQFKPGARNGVPVPVAVYINVWMQTCAERGKSDNGTNAQRLVFRSQPEQQISVAAEVPPFLLAAWGSGGQADTPGIEKVGSKVSAPVPLDRPDARYTDSALTKGITGVCLVRLIVDAAGMPQNVHVIVSLEPGLDQNAIEAVKHYRFKPAMKDGHPVAVQVQVEVNFQLRN